MSTLDNHVYYVSKRPVNEGKVAVAIAEARTALLAGQFVLTNLMKDKSGKPKSWIIAANIRREYEDDRRIREYERKHGPIDPFKVIAHASYRTFMQEGIYSKDKATLDVILGLIDMKPMNV